MTCPTSGPVNRRTILAQGMEPDMEKYKIDDMIEFGEQFILKRLADVPEAQINLVTLPPHQALPAHNTDSNVRLLILKGEISMTVAGEKETLKSHEIAALPFDIHMQLANDGDTPAAFIVIKTPNPSALATN
jgi:quercetin dioxygenase-like cupin family protein